MDMNLKNLKPHQFSPVSNTLFMMFGILSNKIFDSKLLQ